MASRSRKIVGAWRPKRTRVPWDTLEIGALAIAAAVAFQYRGPWGALTLFGVFFLTHLGIGIYKDRDLRRRSFTVVKSISPGEVRLGNGAVVNVAGLTGVYREGDRQITFTLQPPKFEGFPPPRVPIEQLGAWDPPHQGEQLAERKRREVSQSIQTAALALMAKPLHPPPSS